MKSPDLSKASPAQRVGEALYESVNRCQVSGFRQCLLSVPFFAVTGLRSPLFRSMVLRGDQPVAPTSLLRAHPPSRRQASAMELPCDKFLYHLSGAVGLGAFFGYPTMFATGKDFKLALAARRAVRIGELFLN